MPVHTGNYHIDTDKHFSFANLSEIKSSEFVDKFRIKNLYFSIGDVFLTLGLIFFLYLESKTLSEIVKYKKEEKNRKKFPQETRGLNRNL
jgi:hypothetical protein